MRATNDLLNLPVAAKVSLMNSPALSNTSSSANTEQQALLSDERNLGRLGLIIAQNRLKPDRRTWSKLIQTGPLGMINITCTAIGNHAVPHGIDNDILFGLTSSFIEQGTPVDNTITLSMAELATASKLTRSGRLYQQISAALERLVGTSYIITDSWQDERFVTVDRVNMSIINRVRAKTNTQEKSSQYQPKTMLQITLDPIIANSIRAGHLSPLNPQLYARLSQPLVRALYRVLSEYQSHHHESQLTVPLTLWARLLGLPEESHRVKRNLQPAHDELIQLHYLEDAIYTGRGNEVQLTYRFCKQPQATEYNPYIQLLTKRHVTEGPAKLLTSQFAPKEIEAACQTFDHLQQSGYPMRSPGALMTDILRRPEAYNSSVIPQKNVTVTTKSAPRPPQVVEESAPPSDPASRERTFQFLIKLHQKNLQDAGLKEQDFETLKVLFINQQMISEELSLLAQHPNPTELLKSYQQRQ